MPTKIFVTQETIRSLHEVNSRYFKLLKYQKIKKGFETTVFKKKKKGELIPGKEEECHKVKT